MIGWKVMRSQRHFYAKALSTIVDISTCICVLVVVVFACIIYVAMQAPIPKSQIATRG